MLSFLKSLLWRKESEEEYRARRDAENDRHVNLMVEGLNRGRKEHIDDMVARGFDSFKDIQVKDTESRA